MAYCPYCGNEVDPAQATCRECGHPLAAPSPRRDRTPVVIAVVVGTGAFLLLVAVLVAIAVPTFLGARYRAQDRTAQSAVRNALTAAAVVFTDEESFRAVTPQRLRTLEPDLFFVEGSPSTGPQTVSIEVYDDREFHAVALSASGTCFAARVEVGITTYASRQVPDCRPDAFRVTEYRGSWD